MSTNTIRLRLCKSLINNPALLLRELSGLTDADIYAFNQGDYLLCVSHYLAVLRQDELHQRNREHEIVYGWLLTSKVNNREEAKSHCNRSQKHEGYGDAIYFSVVVGLEIQCSWL